MASEKLLILYYSVADVVNRDVAERIQKHLGGDIARIETKEPYPENHQELINYTRKEFLDGEFPELNQLRVDLDSYENIIIGTPNWFATLATPIRSFLRENPLPNKRLMLFVTHGGGALGKCLTDLQTMCPDAHVVPEALVLQGSMVDVSDSEIAEWCGKIKEILEKK